MTRLFLLLSSLMLLGSCAKHDPAKIIDAFATKNINRSTSTGPQLIPVKLDIQEAIEKYGLENRIDCSAVQAIFQVNAEGFCPGDRYTLYQVNFMGEIGYMGDFVVDEPQNLISKRGQPLSEYPAVCSNLVRGEPAAYVLVSQDQTSYITALLTADPIEATFDDGAYVWITPVTPDMELFYANGTNFKNDDTISFESKSDKIAIKDTAKVKNGEWRALLAPSICLNGGHTQLTVTRPATKETRILKYKYGPASKIRE